MSQPTQEAPTSNGPMPERMATVLRRVPYSELRRAEDLYAFRSTSESMRASGNEVEFTLPLYVLGTDDDGF